MTRKEGSYNIHQFSSQIFLWLLEKGADMADRSRKGLPKRAATGKNKWTQAESYKEKVRQQKLARVLRSCGATAAADRVKKGHAQKGDLEMIAASENSLSAKAMEALKLL